MITKSEFLNQVHGRIFPLLKKCETERIAALKKWGVGMGILSIVLMVILFRYSGLDIGDKANENIIILFVFISFIPSFIGCLKLDNFSKKIKQKFLFNLYEGLGLKEIKTESGIIKEDVKNIPSNLIDYEVDSTNPVDFKVIIWTNSNLFPQDINGFDYDDCFIDVKNSLSVFELDISQPSGKSSNTIFKGPVIEFNSNIKMDDKIVILQEVNFLSSKYFRPDEDIGYQKFQTNDVVFDKEFSVYAQNENEAKSLLNKVFLRQILAVKELYPKAVVNFLIENGKITVSINTDKDMFEFFSITHSLLHDKFFEQFYDEINTIYKVKDLLNR